MPDLAKWLDLYGSDNRSVKLRAARALLRRSEEAPLATLLDILDTLSHERLGATVERILRGRRDPELLAEMVGRLASPDDFIRSVACNVLGQLGDSAAAPHLVPMLDDSRAMVRRAAAYALGEIKDPDTLPALKRQRARRHSDDVNVRMALDWALKELTPPQRR